MNKTTIITWILWSIIILAVLAGAYLIIDKNQSAASGADNKETPAFYGH